MPKDAPPVKMVLGRPLPDQYNHRPENNKAPPPKGEKGSEPSGTGWEAAEGMEPRPLSHSGAPFKLKR